MTERYSHETVFPSSYFEHGEDAIEELCRGCVKDTGWIDDPRIVTPDCAMSIILDVPDSIEIIHGTAQCPSRFNEWRKAAAAEFELYQRRMNGDWS